MITNLSSIAFDFSKPRVRVITDNKSRALDKCSMASYIGSLYAKPFPTFYEIYWDKSDVHYGEMAEKLYELCLAKGVRTIGEPTLNQHISKFN